MQVLWFGIVTNSLVYHLKPDLFANRQQKYPQKLIQLMK